ncbi:MAG: endolytic transglycosylase MltG [Alphaproteobacteria bacterium]|nr:endolytic transglycosylase MltG [Alphaproteobacteria bacterium]
MSVRRTLLLLAGLLILACGVAAGGAFLWARHAFHAPGPAAGDVTLILPRGAGLAEIARRLEEGRVVADRRLFAAGVYWYGQERQLQAGEYRFPAAISAHAAMRLLAEGRRVQRRLTVPEGLTVAEIQKLLAATEGLVLDEPLGAPPEGSLLPETYFFSHGDSAAALQSRMRRAMEQALAEAWAARKPGLPLKSPEEALILASIIEKETGRTDERARVSGVFHNRLKRGMRLQSDPTVIYGLTSGQGPLGRDLTRGDLNRVHAWNTYQIDGLPAHPIANPGRASIEAALQPEETRDLYFVADGEGGHRFAETLEQHNRNVARWRRMQR